MARFPRHAVLAAAVAGLLLGSRASWAVWPTAAGLGVWAALHSCQASKAAQRWRAAGVPALAAAAVLLGAWVADARMGSIDRTSLTPLLGHAADVRATVLQPPRPRSFGRSAVLAEAEGERVLVIAQGRLNVGVGDIARIRGGWAPLPAFEAAAGRAGAHALLRAESIRVVGRRGGVLGAIDAVRRRAERAIDRGLPRRLAGLARGMVLGQDDRLDDATTEAFRASGLAHLVAASGANVALLAALALGVCALLGVPRAPRLWLTLALVAAYVPLAGGGPSIQRAGVMGIAALVAALASQPTSRWYALLLAAAATLTMSPRAAEDPGWQLSFTAVLSLMLLTPRLRTLLEQRLPRTLAEALALSLAATFATAPLIALHFERLSWVSVPANLLALPAVAPVMWLGTLAGATGQVSQALAAPLAALAALPLAWVGWVARTTAALPGADAQAGPVTALVALAAVAGLFHRRTRWLVVAGVLAFAAWPHGTPAAPDRLTISALDVGQGDATLIQHQGHAVLVDAGPPDGPILERLREAGVTRLDLLVVTHAQADHEGGAARVLEELPVGLVLDGRDGVATRTGAAWAAAARERGVGTVAPATGQRIAAGPIVLDVLGPRPEPAAAHAGEDPNDRAIVLTATVGAFSMLLAADAESAVLSTFAVPDVDVYKVAHHGSADPGLPALLARIRPEIALIEVGEGNGYGHPAPETLAALAGIDVRRTDRDGTVVLQP